ncbi:MAG: response regulator transcription factor [Flavobacteriaceae bacterium]|nr:response regulator transcription factor [Flavobacteriaceae bacterium]
MKVNIIIADDHQLFIDGIKSILQNEIDISIIGEANNGLELIRLVEKGMLPNIILTDIRMPVMDGISATRILTKEHPKIPILALSMYDQQIDVVEMIEAGAKGYITKNVQKKELIQAIHELLHGNQYFSKNLDIDSKEFLTVNSPKSNQKLTRREHEILALLIKGRTTLQMAEELKLSKYTIDTHRKNIHKKIGIKSNAGLVNYALNHMNLNY